MISINLTVDLDITNDLLNLINSSNSVLNQNSFPNTANAVLAASELVKNKWSNYLAGDNNLDGVRSLTDKEISSLKGVKVFSRVNTPMDISVIAKHKNIEKLQNGEPDIEYDMKKTHPYGKKSRVTKTGKNKGIPYLIIPFRWGTPNDKGSKRAHFNNFIPTKIYNTSVKHFQLSSIKGTTHLEPNYKNENIPRQEYTWKDRLINASDERMEGLVRMKANNKSSYFTFRIVSANSPQNKWWYRRKGSDGVDMLNALKRSTEKEINDLIKSGFEADLGVTL